MATAPAATVDLVAVHTNRLRCCHRFIGTAGVQRATCPRCQSTYRLVDGAYVKVER